MMHSDADTVTIDGRRYNPLTTGRLMVEVIAAYNYAVEGNAKAAWEAVEASEAIAEAIRSRGERTHIELELKCLRGHLDKILGGALTSGTASIRHDLIQGAAKALRDTAGVYKP